MIPAQHCSSHYDTITKTTQEQAQNRPCKHKAKATQKLISFNCCSLIEIARKNTSETQYQLVCDFRIQDMIKLTADVKNTLKNRKHTNILEKCESESAG